MYEKLEIPGSNYPVDNPSSCELPKDQTSEWKYPLDLTQFGSTSQRTLQTSERSAARVGILGTLGNILGEGYKRETKTSTSTRVKMQLLWKLQQQIFWQTEVLKVASSDIRLNDPLNDAYYTNPASRQHSRKVTDGLRTTSSTNCQFNVKSCHRVSVRNSFQWSHVLQSRTDWMLKAKNTKAVPAWK